MNIIHYLIGFPPLRHGGAPKYAIDLLMAQQKLLGRDNVAMIVAGDTFRLGHIAHINRKKNFQGVRCYAIDNPVVPPLLYGLRKAEYILDGERQMDNRELDWFYNEMCPSVLHVHTLMGLPMALLEFMKSKGVTIVYTSHDYYGICPQVKLIDRLGHICECSDGTLCKDCNIMAKPLWFLKLSNSYLFLKNKKWLPRKAAVFRGGITDVKCNSYLTPSDDGSFVRLRDYYSRMMSMMDGVHFNSEVSRSVYERHFQLPHHEVIAITNTSVSDRRQRKTFGKTVRMNFVSGLGTAKGYPMLRRLLMQLKAEGYDNWTLSVRTEMAFGEDAKCPNIKFSGKYTSDQLPEVYREIDLLVVPSIWQETFNLVALEALSFGVPVLMSENVGAKMLVSEIAPDFVYHGEEELRIKLRQILENPKVLDRYNLNVCQSQRINFSEDRHAEEIIDFYKRTRK